MDFAALANPLGVDASKVTSYAALANPLGVDASKVVAYAAIVTAAYAPPIWTLAAMTSGVVGTTYLQAWDMPTAALTVIYTVLSGSLPPGLSLVALIGNEAEISGTPTTQGAYTFTLRATNIYGTADRAFLIIITQAPTPESINYIKTFAQSDQGNYYTLALDSGGTLYQTNVAQANIVQTPFTLNPSGLSVYPNLFCNSTTLDDYEYLTFSNLLTSEYDVPMQYSGRWFDRISQVGPGAAPTFTGTGGASEQTAITAFSITGNIVTFTASNVLTVNEVLTISGLTVGTYLNGLVGSVLGSGLSSTQFEMSFTHANVSSTPDNGFATPAFGYPILSITQFPKQSTNRSGTPGGGDLVAILWSQGPGNSSPGNTITVYYLEGPEYKFNPEDQTGDLNLINAFNSGQSAVCVNITGAAFGNGTQLVTSVGCAQPPSSGDKAWYFTFNVPTSSYQFAPSFPPGQYQMTQATLTTSTPIPNLSVGDAITVSGVSTSGWNNTWSVTQTLNSGVMNITQTEMNASGVATYTYSVTSGVAPTVGELITVINCLNGNGIFNVTNCSIATVTPNNSTALNLTSVNASGVYVGTITDGAGNTFAGNRFTILGFSNAANNGTFLCLASTSTTLTLQNINSVVETHPATATQSSGTGVFTITGFPAVAITTAPETGQAETSGTQFTFEPGLSVVGSTTSAIYGNAGAGGIVTVSTSSTSIGAGPRAAVVFFTTRNGLNTACSAPVTFTVGNSANYILASNIPVGPPNVVSRTIAFTGAGSEGQPGPNYYYIAAPVTYTLFGQVYNYTSTVISDNTTTSAKFNFVDGILLSGIEIDVNGNNIFNQIELGSSAWTIAYSSRLFFGMEQNKVLNFTNLTFDGGYVPASSVTTVSSNELLTPVVGVLTSASHGGTLLSSVIYWYRVAATNYFGTTLASDQKGIQPRGFNNTGIPTSNNTVTIPWNPVTGASGYKVYGRTNGAEQLLATVSGSTLTWTDTGSITPAGALPTANTTGSPLTPSQVGAIFPLGWTADPSSNLNVGNPATITSFSITSNVVTFICGNNFLAGQEVNISGLSAGTYLNGVIFQVISDDLSSTQFSADFTYANVSSTPDTGVAVPVQGGATLQTSPVFGNSYYINNSLGSNLAYAGMITQTAYQDAYKVPIINLNTTYGVRVTARCPSGYLEGYLVVDLTNYSQIGASSPPIASPPLSPPLSPPISSYGEPYGSFVVPFSSMSTQMQTFTGSLLTTAFTSTVPAGLLLRVYAYLLPYGADVEIDRIEVFPLTQPVNTTNVRVSYVDNFEAFDAITGNIGLGSHNNQPCYGAFELYDTLYFLQETSMQSTKDIPGDEPSGQDGKPAWPITEVSNRVGTCGINAYDYGEDWMVTACRNGLYGYNGGSIMRIDFQQKEIWESINWEAGKQIIVRNDLPNRRIYCWVPLPTPNQWLPLAPVNAAPVTPNVCLMFNYQGLGSFLEMVDGKGIHTSMFGTLVNLDMRMKVALWNITTPYAGFITAPDLNSQGLQIGNGAANGKIYGLSAAQLSDDGVAINSRYTTYGFTNSTKAAQYPLLGFFRKRYQGIQLLMDGAGNAGVQLYPNWLVNKNTNQLNPYAYTVPGGVTLSATPIDDYWRPLNISGNRVFVSVFTNAVGSFFNLSKLIMAGTSDPYSSVNPNV